jgi:hypothetical protein
MTGKTIPAGTWREELVVQSTTQRQDRRGYMVRSRRFGAPAVGSFECHQISRMAASKLYNSSKRVKDIATQVSGTHSDQFGLGRLPKQSTGLGWALSRKTSSIQPSSVLLRLC